MVNAENITIYGMFGALALVIGGLFLKNKKSKNIYNNMKNSATEVGNVASEIVKSVSHSPSNYGSGTFTSSSKGGSKRKSKRRK
jgi:hypothetical protein